MNNRQQRNGQDVFTTQTNLAMERRPLGGVRQDKSAFSSARAPSSQPYRPAGSRRSAQSGSSIARSQKATDRRRRVPVIAWVEPEVKAEIERIGKQEGLSVSAVGAAWLRDASRQKLHLQHAALLEPLVEQAIRRQMGAISTRLAHLLVRVAFDAGQTRALVTNILGRQAGMSPDALKSILEGSGKSAKANITRRTPQMKNLIAAVEQWMVDDKGTTAMPHGNRKDELYQKQTGS